MSTSICVSTINIEDENFLKSKMSMAGLNEEDCDDISSLITDYYLLDSLIQSNKFEKSLELYSVISNININNQNNVSLKLILEEILEEYSNFLSNKFEEFIKIFQKPEIHSLICSYDLINQYNFKQKN